MRTYNPFSDGVSAQVWELLRRNTDFLKHTAAGGDFKKLDPFTYAHASSEYAFNCVKDGKISADTSWDTAGRPFKKKFTELLGMEELQDLSMPDELCIAYHDFDLGPEDYREMRLSEKLKAHMKKIEDVLPYKQVLAVPSVICDRSHRERLLREFRAALDSVGTTPIIGEAREKLGTDWQWHVYGLFEALIGAGFEEKDAMKLLAEFVGVRGNKERSITGSKVVRWARKEHKSKSKDSRNRSKRKAEIKRYLAVINTCITHAFVP